MTLSLVFTILTHVIDFTTVALYFLPFKVIKIFPKISHRFICCKWKVGILPYTINRVLPGTSWSCQLRFRLKLHSTQLRRWLLWIGCTFSLLASVHCDSHFLNSILCYSLLSMISSWVTHFNRHIIVIFLCPLTAEVVCFQVFRLFIYLLVF